jgi:uncharacterized spore protein YtfJ
VCEIREAMQESTRFRPVEEILGDNTSQQGYLIFFVSHVSYGFTSS